MADYVYEISRSPRGTWWWSCDLDDCGERSGIFDSEETAEFGFRYHVNRNHPHYVGIVP